MDPNGSKLIKTNHTLHRAACASVVNVILTKYTTEAMIRRSGHSESIF